MRFVSPVETLKKKRKKRQFDNKTTIAGTCCRVKWARRRARQVLWSRTGNNRPENSRKSAGSRKTNWNLFLFFRDYAARTLRARFSPATACTASAGYHTGWFFFITIRRSPDFNEIVFKKKKKPETLRNVQIYLSYKTKNGPRSHFDRRRRLPYSVPPPDLIVSGTLVVMTILIQKVFKEGRTQFAQCADYRCRRFIGKIGQ